MKVYFSSSPRGKTELLEKFKELRQYILDLHYTINHDFLTQDDEHYYSKDQTELASQFKKSMVDLKRADIAVFEVSTHSLGVGFLINKALEFGVSTVVLHLPDRSPVFLEGIENRLLQVVEYTPANAKKTLEKALKNAEAMVETRFNFFISTKQEQFLDRISRDRKIPKSAYLRNLLNREMAKEIIT